jgi:hypothetical protein
MIPMEINPDIEIPTIKLKIKSIFPSPIFPRSLPSYPLHYNPECLAHSIAASQDIFRGPSDGKANMKPLPSLMRCWPKGAQHSANLETPHI